MTSSFVRLGLVAATLDHEIDEASYPYSKTQFATEYLVYLRRYPSMMSRFSLLVPEEKLSSAQLLHGDTK
jgi:hypothetical protein